jgi:alkanesulfonate monooxygenase SsuD/methylene tetrahydromethanopterin reductase-like flavin-dependent oxidoreductase (luciferase family)
MALEFFAFNLMAWPYLPDDYKGPAWIDAPNSMFDPEKGHHLYNRYLDELESTEALGFDGVVVNEHHQSAYGLMPSPNLFAAALARRTERIKIAVVGDALPLYMPPLRVAEEMAILDVITGGRLIAGFVVGGGAEYYSFPVNPTQARARFNESLELIMRAWTEPGPFEFEGRFYSQRKVNPWPTPLQKPHPEVMIPGAGSPETMALVAKWGFTYTGLPFFRFSVTERNYSLFRRTWLEAGREPATSKLGLLMPIYVAETDAVARREYEDHLWYFAHRLLNGVQLQPPGYAKAEAALKMASAMKDFLLSIETFDDVLDGGFAAVGSPATVSERLAEMTQALGTSRVMNLFSIGDLPGELTEKSLTLFAQEVIPALKREFPRGPAWKEVR